MIGAIPGSYFVVNLSLQRNSVDDLYPCKSLIFFFRAIIRDHL